MFCGAFIERVAGIVVDIRMVEESNLKVQSEIQELSVSDLVVAWRLRQASASSPGPHRSIHSVMRGPAALHGVLVGTFLYREHIGRRELMGVMKSQGNPKSCFCARRPVLCY